jgi:hypothetical protein
METSTRVRLARLRRLFKPKASTSAAGAVRRLLAPRRAPGPPVAQNPWLMRRFDTSKWVKRAVGRRTAPACWGQRPLSRSCFRPPLCGMHSLQIVARTTGLGTGEGTAPAARRDRQGKYQRENSFARWPSSNRNGLCSLKQPRSLNSGGRIVCFGPQLISE